MTDVYSFHGDMQPIKLYWTAICQRQPCGRKSIYVIYGVLNIILCKENNGYKAKYLYSFPKLTCSWFVNVCVSKLFSISP